MIQRGLMKECRCGQRFEHLEGPEGNLVPVQRIRSLYTIKQGLLVRLGDMREQRETGIWMNHLEVCPSRETMVRKFDVRRH